MGSGAASAGVVAQIWRYPVKSMAGEAVGATELGKRGVAGDRAYALLDRETGALASAKHPRRWAALLSCSARYLAEPAAGGAALRAIDPCPRCVVTTLAQGGLPHDPGVLRALAAHTSAASVTLAPGRIFTAVAGIYGRMKDEGRGSRI